MIKQYQTKTDYLFWHGLKNCSALLAVPSTSARHFSSVNKDPVQVMG